MLEKCLLIGHIKVEGLSKSLTGLLNVKLRNCPCVAVMSSDDKMVSIFRQMSCLMTKPTKWHVRPAKTQISLGIRPV